jgi:hypothetical protein
MRRVDAAEWILSLTTTPERAATTAGDLTEETPARGALWFWWSLSRTTASLVWRTFAEAPRFTAGMAFKACVLEAKILGFFGVLLNAYIKGFKLEQRGILLVSEAVMIACYFCVGALIARRAPARELSACLAFLSMDSGIRAAIYFLLQEASMPLDPGLLFLAPLIIAANLLALFAGIDQIRKGTTQLTSQ